MINKVRTAVLALLLAITSGGAFAQEVDGKPTGSGAMVNEAAQQQPAVDMATGLYQSGKIYVVVVVLSIIMAGIAGYLVMLDRKIAKLEKEVKNR